ncbi:BON domain-containing protein [Nitrosomonas sp.]|uniref:BON domain-containing protein n=1 Tax=Nitrosomonas sp. TaxID=42353 RepID=UPI00374DB4DE
MNFNNKLSVLTLTLIGILSITGCDIIEGKASQPNAKTTVGMEVDDSVATTAVKSALLKDTGLNSLDIKVETRKGEVQLSGFVDSQTQLDRAIEITKGVDGVKGVLNKMSIKK